MNNALRQAGYEGELLPTSEEMENYTEEDIQEFVGETERTLEEMMRRLEADPFVMGKVLIALGINVSKLCALLSSDSPTTEALTAFRRGVVLGLPTLIHGSSTKH